MSYQSYFMYLRAALGVHAARLRAAAREGERGASAVELAIITAMMLIIAGAVVAAIKIFTTNANNQIQNTSTQP
jgi:Flp pilus assembly protein TadG